MNLFIVVFPKPFFFYFENNNVTALFAFLNYYFTFLLFIAHQPITFLWLTEGTERRVPSHPRISRRYGRPRSAGSFTPAVIVAAALSIFLSLHA